MKKSLKNKFKNSLNFLKTFLKKPIFWLKQNKKISYALLFLMIFPISFIYAEGFWNWVNNPILNGIRVITDIGQYLMSLIIYAVGFVFDNIMYLSITPYVYDQEWILVAWGTIRELANIAFILGVIYIGFSMIFNLSSWKSKLINLIIVAFIVNFSWTIGRIIVDAGNFTAGIFYSMTSVRVDTTIDANGIDISDKNRYVIVQELLGVKEESYFGARSIAVGLVAFLDPSELYDNKTFQNTVTKSVKGKEKKEESILEIKILLNLVFIFIITLLAGPLLQGAFMMLSRTLLIIKHLMFAPAYFVAYFLPGGDGMLMKWFSDIAKKSFCLTGYMVGFWVLFLFLGNMSTDIIGMLGDNLSIFTVITVIVFKAIFLKKGLDMLNDYGAKECADGEVFGEKMIGFVGALAGGVAKFPGSVVGGSASMFTRGVAHRSINGLSNFLDKRAGKGGAIADSINSWASRKADNLYNFKIGSKTVREDLENHAQDEQADLRRIRKAQGEDAEKAYRLKRLSVRDVNKIDESLFDDKTKKKLSDIKDNPDKRKEEIRKEQGFGSTLTSKEEELVEQEYDKWANKEATKIKTDFALNNYDKVRKTAAVEEGAWSSMMEVMTGVHGSMTALNKDYLAAQNRLKAEEARLKAEVGKASDVYNNKDTEESMKLRKRQLRLQEVENEALEENATAQQTMIEILKGLADDEGIYNGIDTEALGELNNKESFDNFIENNKAQLGELATTYENNNTDWESKQAAHANSKNDVNNAKNQLTELEKRLIDAENGVGKEFEVEEEYIDKATGLKKTRKVKKVVVEDVAELKKKIINKKNTVSEAESKLANAEREFKNMLNSTMQVANEISSDMKKSAMNAAKDELERVQRTVSEKVGQVQREIKELSEAEGTGKVFTRGVDEKNT